MRWCTTGGEQSRSANTSAAPAGAPGEPTATRGFGVGGLDDGWVACAFSRAWLGAEKNPERARRMARNEDGDLLPARAGWGNRGWPGDHLRQAGGSVAGGALGVWTAAKLGGPARQFRPGQRNSGLGRWGPLDLECGAGPLGRRQAIVGFLPWQRTSLGVGASRSWPGRGPSQTLICSLLCSLNMISCRSLRLKSSLR